MDDLIASMPSCYKQIFKEIVRQRNEMFCALESYRGLLLVCNVKLDDGNALVSSQEINLLLILTQWFGFYAPGQDTVVESLQDSDLYKLVSRSEISRHACQMSRSQSHELRFFIFKKNSGYETWDFVFSKYETSFFQSHELRFFKDTGLFQFLYDETIIGCTLASTGKTFSRHGQLARIAKQQTWWKSN